MAQSSRKTWQVVVAVGLMLAAMFAYLSTLDDSDPAPMSEMSESMDGDDR